MEENEKMDAISIGAFSGKLEELYHLILSIIFGLSPILRIDTGDSASHAVVPILCFL